MAKLKPLYDKLILERLQAEERTAGGILLPDTAKEKPTEGRVVAVGSGRVLDDGRVVPPTLKVGDRVLFGSYTGSEVKSEGKNLLILDEGEVLAVVDDAPWADAPAAETEKKAAKKNKK